MAKKTQEAEGLKKVDFRKVTLLGVDGKGEIADVSRAIGNYLYENTADIAEMDFAKKLYYEGEVELTKERATYIQEMIWQSKTFKAKLKVAIKELLRWD